MGDEAVTRKKVLEPKVLKESVLESKFLNACNI